MQSMPEKKESRITELADELIAMCGTDQRGENDRDPFLGRNNPNNERVREIGWELHRIGGVPVMERVLWAIPLRDRNDLDLAWDGVGEWEF